jgi:uncharacterized membrane protein
MKLFKDKNLSKKSIISIICLLFVIGGIFGFIYEELFYKIDLGYFVKRGSTFGPWIPIYGYGSLLIVLMSYWARKKSWLVFLLNCLVTGILELGTGFVLDKYFNLRLWNYNEEIWNWGNYNGYICIRSVLFFGVSSLLLIYAILPLLFKIVKKKEEKKQENILLGVSIALALTFAIDIILYMIIK